MINFIKTSLITLFIVSNIYSQEIVFITPNQGYQGTNDLEITLVATGVNFYDQYTYYDVYFEGNGLDAYNEQVLSSNTLKFDLDINSNVEPLDYTIYLEKTCNSWYWWDCQGNEWTISDYNAFTVYENLAEITSITPNSIQAGTTSVITLYGSETNWDSSSQVSITNDNFWDSYADNINVHSTNYISETMLQAEIFVEQWAVNQYYDVVVNTGNSSVALDNGLLVTPAPPISIQSIYPSSGNSGENLWLSIDLANVNFYDSYTNLSVSFSDNNLNVSSTYIQDWNTIGAYVSIEPWANAGLYDLTVGVTGPNGGQWYYDTAYNAFEVHSSESGQLVSISPNSSYPNTSNLIVNIVGEGVDFYDDYADNSVHFSGNGIYVDWVNTISDTLLQAQIDITHWANPGFRDVTVTSDGTTVGLANAFEIQEPEIISLTPDYGAQGVQDLQVTLLAGGINFYDQYTNINGINFSHPDLYATNYQITGPNTVAFQLSANNVSPGNYAVSLSYFDYWNWHDYVLYQNDAFTVLDSNSVENTLTLSNTQVANGTDSLSVQVDLQTYYSVSGIQFVINESSGSLNYIWSHDFINNFNMIGAALPDGSTQITLYSPNGQNISPAFNGPLCQISFNVDGDIINDEILLSFSDMQVIDSNGNEIAVTGNNGSIIFGDGAPNYTLGDVNSDSILDILDIVSIVNYLIGTAEYNEEQIFLSDINSDGTTDILDIVLLINIIMDSNNLSKNPPIFDDATLKYGNDKVKLITQEGIVAGLQLEVSGEFEITKDYLPEGWGLSYGEDRIIIYNYNGENLTSDLLFEYTGDLTLHDNIIADWHSNSIDAEMILVPKEFALHNAYPNPFNPTTTIKFALPEDVNISIIAYDIQGREVATLINGNYASGYHQVQWDANNTFSSGIYFVRMIAGDYIHTQKVMLVK